MLTPFALIHPLPSQMVLSSNVCNFTITHTPDLATMLFFQIYYILNKYDLIKLLIFFNCLLSDLTPFLLQ